jgi:hypothetical protein
VETCFEIFDMHVEIAIAGAKCPEIYHEFFSMLILLDWLKSEKQGKTQCSVAIWCMGWWWQGCVLVSSRIIHAVISEPNCSSAASLS